MMHGVTVRPMKQQDLSCGFLDTLQSLSQSEISSSAEIYQKIRSNPDHEIFVAVINDKIVGSTTALIEPKFIHNGGKVCHIEDVVVDKTLQDKGIGRLLIEAALEHAKSSGCYKTMLYCTDTVAPFYEKLGFKQHHNAMRIDH